jgi:hypothetical protein
MPANIIMPCSDLVLGGLVASMDVVLVLDRVVGHLACYAAEMI